MAKSASSAARSSRPSSSPGCRPPHHAGDGPLATCVSARRFWGACAPQRVNATSATGGSFERRGLAAVCHCRGVSVGLDGHPNPVVTAGRAAAHAELVGHSYGRTEVRLRLCAALVDDDVPAWPLMNRSSWAWRGVGEEVIEGGQADPPRRSE
jgi:hypothetical protein